MLINERVVCSLMTGIGFDCVILVESIIVLRLYPFIKTLSTLSIFVDLQKKMIKLEIQLNT